MEPVVSRVQNQELTQELKLSDGMPDVGQVLSAWGQFVLRGKEWRSDSFSASGGMMVWVLYAPEDGTRPRCIHGWMPCQMQWDLPPDTPDGKIRILCLTRFVDARSVSPRKIMVRTGISALGEGYVRREGSTWMPGEVEENVQLLRRSYPVTLAEEAGEKTFQLDEELSLPPSAPKPEKLICATLQPEITEQKVLGSRVVFRGNGNLHMLYLSEEGQIHAWDFPIPFSQYEDLDQSYGKEAKAEIMLMPTDLDVDLNEDGKVRAKGGMVAQYVLEECRMIDVVEDAYCPGRELEIQSEVLELPVVLEEKLQTLNAEARISQNGEFIADASFLPDFPKEHRMGDQVELEQPGMFQVLTFGTEQGFQGTAGRWEGKVIIPAHPECQIRSVPGNPGQARGEINGDGMVLRAQVPLTLRTMASQSIPMVVGLTLGQSCPPDPGRPSLILCRAGEESLWQLARKSGSTVEAIRQATGLDGEPIPGQMLLIPVL